MALPNPSPARWSIWTQVPEVELWEAVALSLDVEPSGTYSSGKPLTHEDCYRENAEYRDRFFLAERNLSKHKFLQPIPIQTGPARFTVVSLGGFAAWACELAWKIPTALEGVATKWAENNVHITSQRGRWPWGDHETQLLNILAEAAHQFWSTYDPADPLTAPKSTDVEDWLKGKGVAKRVAEIIAQILRADGLKTGPKK